MIFWGFGPKYRFAVRNIGPPKTRTNRTLGPRNKHKTQDQWAEKMDNVSQWTQKESTTFAKNEI